MECMNMFKNSFVIAALIVGQSCLANTVDYKSRICEYQKRLAGEAFENHQVFLETGSEKQAIFLMKDFAQYQDYAPNSTGKILLDKMIEGLTTGQSKSALQSDVYHLCMTFSEHALRESTVDQNEIKK